MKKKWTEARDLQPIKGCVEDGDTEKEVWICPYCDEILSEYFYSQGINGYYSTLECKSCGTTFQE